MSRPLVHLYCCKLKLIRFGFVKEAKELDNIIAIHGKTRGDQARLDADGSDDESDEDGSQSTLINKITTTTNECISRLLNNADANTCAIEQDETVIGARKRVIKALEYDLINGSKCASCNL